MSLPSSRRRPAAWPSSLSAALLASLLATVLTACGGGSSGDGASTTGSTTASFPASARTFGSRLDPARPANYAAQPVPAYITRDLGAPESDAVAQLGRVLFHDRSLSVDGTVSCASCHQQRVAFSDTALASTGVAGGVTARHSMRLVNARFGAEPRFFWDERAATLEAQTTRPIQDHAEMGFSGQLGRPGLPDLLARLQALDYLNELFTLAYGDATVTEARLQRALGAFVRSIQSFDTRYDAGRAAVAGDAQAFPNFTAQENLGKQLFLTPPLLDASGVRIAGGLGCAGCHRPPEFAIDPASGNNGIIGTLAGNGRDLTVTRAPTLRDLLDPAGQPNGPMMHTGVIATLRAAIGHYGSINANPNNTGLDLRLAPGGVGQQLQLTATEVDAVAAFMRTLTGSAVYTDARWSDPFLR
jgi:cytochrome c peroxidase